MRIGKSKHVALTLKIGNEQCGVDLVRVKKGG